MRNVHANYRGKAEISLTGCGCCGVILCLNRFRIWIIHLHTHGRSQVLTTEDHKGIAQWSLPFLVSVNSCKVEGYGSISSMIVLAVHFISRRSLPHVITAVRSYRSSTVLAYIRFNIRHTRFNHRIRQIITPLCMAHNARTKYRMSNS